jgi:cbb3-type cytochrome oxidase maturation protein
VSFLLLTIPVTLLLSAALLLLVLRSVRDGQYEDWEGPAWRMLYDDDRQPEIEGDLDLGRDADDSEPPSADHADAGDVRRTT